VLACLSVSGLLATASVHAQATTAFSTGAFADNTVLALAGTAAQEVYGVNFADNTARTTANGYAFDNAATANVSYDIPGSYPTFLGGGGTTGDATFDTILNKGSVGTGTGTLVLRNLSPGGIYKVLFLLADTRSTLGGRTFSVTAGSITSATQVYAFTGGTPSLGGYVLGSFTATGATQTFVINNSYGHQLNAILVCCSGAAASFTTGTFTDNTVLAQAGFPKQVVYGVNFGENTARTTANGYVFDADSSTNVSYNVSGNYGNFLGGGGASGDTAFDSLIKTGRVGTGNGTLILKNLAAGVPYKVLFLLADTRTSLGGRACSITGGGVTSASQVYAFTGGTPSLGGYILASFTAAGMTQTFTLNDAAYGRQIDAVLVCSVGANTPFKTIEAESGTLGGGAIIRALGATLPSVHTVELESSGRALVELASTGDSVTWINQTSINANAIVVRASIPDSLTGGGIDATLNLYVNGVFRQALNLTSRYSWTYDSGWQDDVPGVGKNPQRFYDEARAFIMGAPIAPGSTLMLKKDAANTAAFYDIDLIDLENVGPAKTQPANTLSVVDYGATPNDTTDDLGAFQNCFNAAHTQGKGVWIPAGVFYTNGLITATGITINGAGMWYTTLFRNMPTDTVNGVRSKLDLHDCTIRDLYIDGNAIGRHIPQGADYGMTMYGTSSWLVERVWVHNTAPSFWMGGTNGTIQDCRSGSSWADGINLNNSANPDGLGTNLSALNNYIRGSCDDGIAINAQNGLGSAGNMVNTKILGNTTQAVTGADGLRVAGGRSSIVQNNLIIDPAELDGMVLSTFGTGGNPLESALVKGNCIIGGGSIKNPNSGAIHVAGNAAATVNENVIIDALTTGISIQSGNSTFTGNIVESPAKKGIWIPSGSTGTGIFTSNSVYNLNTGQPAFQNDSPSTFTPTLSGNNW